MAGMACDQVSTVIETVACYLRGWTTSSAARLVDATIVNVGYRSTNYWVISAGRSRLLIDLGWPRTMGLMRANLRRMDVPLAEIRYALATHYHIDHAGLAEELKQAGVPLLVAETQPDGIRLLNEWGRARPNEGVVEITDRSNVALSFAESRELLAGIGIAGELLPTPAHSADSVSLLLDDGSAFTGDLGPLRADEPADLVARCWRLLREHGLRRVYPGHGPAREGSA